MTSLLGLLPAELERLVLSLGQPRYRADQILQAMYRDHKRTIDSMHTLPAALREELINLEWTVSNAKELHRVVSEDCSTTKLLLRMPDGILIETVLMQYPEPGHRHPRSTVCVSTQAGCAMGCVFCATGQMGIERNLRADEILAQVLAVQGVLAERGQHLTNAVFMGMGEPLANYAETVRAIRLMTDPRALGLAQRSVTVSTVGLVHAIDRLAGEGLQIGLAISLHAPNDDLRRQLVPVAGPNSVRELLNAARRYFTTTGRRVTVEYALLHGVNDSPAIATELAHLLRDTGIHVNLIPVNPTPGGFRRPTRAATLAFEEILRDAGVNCTVRAEKGSEISAACGQLRTDFNDDEQLSRSPAGPLHGHRQSSAAPTQSPPQ